MSDPLAYHLTWTAYGTWLSGDERGWASDDQPGIQFPDPTREEHMRRKLADEPVIFDEAQRVIILQTIRDHCQLRRWDLHAANVRSNHIHVVVSGAIAPVEMMSQLKAWCSRRLSDAAGLTTTVARNAGRRRWFTEHGSTKWINDEQYLENVIIYVLNGQ